ncbi:MAG: hypothetical protein HJJLKODD_02246 [Phycisphaerae bacterium]|nr:hypothetical protein [Phycisphaerae bacterium]
MGMIKPPKASKLFVGVLTGDPDLWHRAENFLVRDFGPIDHRSPLWPFAHTNYYRDELGEQVQRCFVSFERLIRPENIAEIKRFTNDIETRLAEEVNGLPELRPVNLDPGYLTLSKVVLATTKDHAHRIYLQRGIFAEVTLHYQDHGWRSWPWTYPDYAADTYHGFFEQMRQLLKNQMSVEPSGSSHDT